jgi:hypothetical protein
MRRSGEPALELVTQTGQFCEIDIVRERLAEPGLVIT